MPLGLWPTSTVLITLFFFISIFDHFVSLLIPTGIVVLFNNFLIKHNLLNVIIITDQETQKNINKSARNIKNLKIINDAGANIYDMMKYKNVLLTQSSVKNLEKRILNEKN